MTQHLEGEAANVARIDNTLQDLSQVVERLPEQVDHLDEGPTEETHQENKQAHKLLGYFLSSS